MQPGAQAALLLTVSLGKADRGAARPLTAREWTRLTAWLEGRGFKPSSLVADFLPDLLSGWNDRTITMERLDALLGRGAALGLALEKWQRAGLWILTRSGPGYPGSLVQRLGATAPPVLFGCGRAALLESGGLAVVGSRDASESDLMFSRHLGAAASSEGHSIISGGARGVDRNAMKGALDNGGTVVAVLADSLLRAATSALYRRSLLSGDLVLVSTVNPEARFNVGNAMARNRYIYCLADAAVVVASALGRGGTWAGACENAKAGWVPLWVRQTCDPGSGNGALVDQGARPLPDALQSLAILFEPADIVSKPDPAGFSEELSSWDEPDPVSITEPEVASSKSSRDHDFYELFLRRLAEITAEAPLPGDALATRLDIANGQVETWLERAVAEDRVEKVMRPVRYRAPHREQPLPFGREVAERPMAVGTDAAIPISGGPDFQDLFVARLKELTVDEPVSSEYLAQCLGIAPGQVRSWIKRGVSDGNIRRMTKPVRYGGRT